MSGHTTLHLLCPVVQWVSRCRLLPTLSEVQSSDASFALRTVFTQWYAILALVNQEEGVRASGAVVSLVPRSRL